MAAGLAAAVQRPGATTQGARQRPAPPASARLPPARGHARRPRSRARHHHGRPRRVAGRDGSSSSDYPAT
eukprot:2042789-Lingulodinium_polyedra.AAC.1